MKRKLYAHTLLWILVCSLLGVSAGCATGTPPAPLTLRIGQNSTAFSYFPVFVAQRQHYFSGQGLTFAPDPFPILGNGVNTSRAFEAGALDIGIGTVTDVMTLSRVNAYVRMIGTFASAFAIDIIVSRQFLQQTHLTEASPLEAKVRALVGKKIGISAPGSATEALLIYLLRRFGDNDYTKAITEVNLGSITPQTAQAALMSGRVDAVSWPVPAGQQAQKEGWGTLFISPLLGDVPELAGMAYGVVYTTTQVMAAKPGAIAALIRAFAQAETFIHAHPLQATAMLATFLKLDPRTTSVLARTALASIPASPQIDQHAYGVADQFHLKAGLIAIALPYTDLVAASTITEALTPVAVRPK